MSEPCDRDSTRRFALRTAVAIAATTAAIGFVLGFFPGIEVYRNAELVETRSVVAHPNWLLGILVVLLAPGALVWRSPRFGYALLWSMWTIAIATLAFVASYAVGESGVRTVALWPHTLFGYVMFALLLHLIAIVPLTCAITWWVTRDRAPRPALPVARVIAR